MARATEVVSLDELVVSREFRVGIEHNLAGRPFAEFGDRHRLLRYEMGRLVAARHGSNVLRWTPRDLVFTVLGMLQNGEIPG